MYSENENKFTIVIRCIKSVSVILHSYSIGKEKLVVTPYAQTHTHTSPFYDLFTLFAIF